MYHACEMEDILSNEEYEEGEILDEDILYDDVSSLEELSESESGGFDVHRKGRSRRNPLEQKLRKKEHKCPELSPCRNERSGKLCYARIRRKLTNGVRDDGFIVDVESRVAENVGRGPRTRNHPRTREGFQGKGRSFLNRIRSQSQESRRRYDKRRGQHFPAMTRPQRTFAAASDSPRLLSSSIDTEATNSPSSSFPRCGGIVNPDPSASSSPVGMTKSSLFDRLVGSGNIEPKTWSDVSSLCSEMVKDNEASGNKEASVNSDHKEKVEVDDDDDEEELRLRLEALKTAVLNKHEFRKKKGIVLSKKMNSESENEFELTNSLEPIDSKNVVQDAATDEHRADSLDDDTGQVGFHIPVINSINPAPRSANANRFRQKCLREIDANKNNIVNKMRKRRRQRRRSRLPKRKGTPKIMTGDVVASLKEIANDDNDEDLLRQIALQSVKPRNPVTTVALTEPNSVLMTALHVETNSTGKASTNPSSSETWEDLDEDILRAQLLSSLSSKMPADSREPAVPALTSPVLAPKVVARNVSYVKRVNKENAGNAVKRLASLNKIQPFIINLSQDSESSEEEEEECPLEAVDICASIDLLLQDARQKTEQEQTAKKVLEETMKREVDINKEKVESPTAQKKNIVRTTSTATPLALRHLPVWQQEEYRQLKLRLAQKEKLREETRRKLAAKFVKTDPQTMSNDSAAALKAQPVQVSGEGTVNRQNTTNSVEPSTNVKRSEVSSDSTKNNSPKPSALSTFAQFKTSLISKELSEMSELVVNLEKELNDYRQSKKEIGRLRRELALASNALTKKRRAILLSKERLKNKEITLAAKIPVSPSPAAVSETTEQRSASRELEIINLKFREIKLRAQVACISMSNDIKTPARVVKSTPKDPLMNLIPKKRLKMFPKSIDRPFSAAPPALTNAKKVISVAESDALDPFTALCPFDLSGVCKDEECKFQHVKSS